MTPLAIVPLTAVTTAILDGNNRVQTRHSATPKEDVMGDGKLDKAKGRVKEAGGDLTGDRELKNEGKVDKAEGTVKDKADDVADKAKDIVGKD